jgi:cell division protein FtsX
MKKIFFSFIGAVIAGLICNTLFWGAGQVAVALDVRLYNSEEEASRNFVIFLVSLFVFIIFGLISGYQIAKKSEKST